MYRTTDLLLVLLLILLFLLVATAAAVAVPAVVVAVAAAAAVSGGAGFGAGAPVCCCGNGRCRDWSTAAAAAVYGVMSCRRLSDMGSLCGLRRLPTGKIRSEAGKWGVIRGGARRCPGRETREDHKGTRPCCVFTLVNGYLTDGLTHPLLGRA